jgi:hypothetical protein
MRDRARPVGFAFVAALAEKKAATAPPTAAEL